MIHVSVPLPVVTCRVGATCQYHLTSHSGLFGEMTCNGGSVYSEMPPGGRVPKIQIFSGWAPSAIISLHISCARAQQPSSG